jgi:hypothetical protein
MLQILYSEKFPYKNNLFSESFQVDLAKLIVVLDYSIKKIIKEHSLIQNLIHRYRLKIQKNLKATDTVMKKMDYFYDDNF